MIPIHEYSDDKNLFMVTKTGIVKKTPLMEFSNVRKNGLTAINLREEDELIEVKITDSSSEIFLVTNRVCASAPRKRMSGLQAELPWVLLV